MAMLLFCAGKNALSPHWTQAALHEDELPLPDSGARRQTFPNWHLKNMLA
jgi:hypothetical protein